MEANVKIDKPLLPEGYSVQSIDWTLTSDNKIVWYNTNDQTGTFTAMINTSPDITMGTLRIILSIIDPNGNITEYSLPSIEVIEDINIEVSDIWAYAPKAKSVRLSDKTDIDAIDIELEGPTFWNNAATLTAVSYIITDLSGNTIVSRLNDKEHLTGLRLDIPNCPNAYVLKIKYHFNKHVNIPDMKLLHMNDLSSLIGLSTSIISSVTPTDIKVSYLNSTLTDITFSISEPVNGVVSTGASEGVSITVDPTGLENTSIAYITISGMSGSARVRSVRVLTVLH